MKNAQALALLVAAHAMALTGSAFAQLEPGVAFPLSEVQRAVIEAKVRDKLKDPDSGQFSGIAAVGNALSDGSTGVTVCGLVNAKNSFGGYVGRRPFIGMLLQKTASRADGFVLISLADGETDGIVKGMCSDKGISGF